MTARDTAPLLQPMLGKDSDVVQYTVKPHIPLTHTVPSPDLETPPEPDSLVCLHTSGGGGGMNNKEVQLHSEPCGCQRLPSAEAWRQRFDTRSAHLIRLEDTAGVVLFGSIQSSDLDVVAAPVVGEKPR